MNFVIKNNTTYKAFSDGSFAISCNAYKSASGRYSYSGDTGDGVYRIKPDAGAPFDVYCDMTTNGGGWTRIVFGATPTMPLNINATTLAALSQNTDPTVSGLSVAFSRVSGKEFRWGNVVSSNYGTNYTMLTALTTIIDTGLNNNKLGFNQGHTTAGVNNDNGESCPFGITSNTSASTSLNGDSYYWNATCWGRSDPYVVPGTATTSRSNPYQYSSLNVGTEAIYLR